MDRLQVLLSCWICLLSCVKADDKVLNLLGLYPLSGIWSGGPAMEIAFKMALGKINERKDILPGYKLEIVWEDTKCHAGVGVNKMFKQLYEPPSKIIIIGAACSHVSEATAIVSHLWKLVQMSSLSSSPTLADKTKFPLFVGINPPRQQINLGRIKMMEDYNWRRLATIHQALDLFSMMTADLVARLQENNMTVITSEVFTDDPTEQVRNLKRHDARIIVSGCFEEKAYKLFCEIYKQGLYGPKYVWIVTGFYRHEWWKRGADFTDCTMEQMAMAVEGSFSANTPLTDIEDREGIGGEKPSEFMIAYRSRMEGIPQFAMEYGPRVYDTAWAAALALNRTQQLLIERGSNKSLEDFTYGDGEMSKMIHESALKLEFQGLIGYIKFADNGVLRASNVIRRIQGGVQSDVGFYDQVHESLEWSVESPIVWQGGNPAADSTTHLDKEIFVDEVTYIVMSSLAGIGILLSLTFGVFNIFFRKERLVKMSSPRLNNVIIVGCVVTYSTVFLQERSNDEIRTCTLMIGFSFAFGALFAKTWRVYAIFMNRTKKVIIRDEQLFLLVALLVGIDVVILVTREIFDPMLAVSREVGTLEYDGGDVMVTNLVWVCTSKSDIYFHGAIYTIKGLLLIFGAFLAWQTRKVKIPALNDSQYIGVCIYNVAVLSLLGVVLAFALMDQLVISYIITSSLIILGTTSTQMVIFIPKITKFKSSQKQSEDEETSATSGSTHGSSIEPSASGGNMNLPLREELEKKTWSLLKAEALISEKDLTIAALRARINGHSSQDNK